MLAESVKLTRSFPIFSFAQSFIGLNAPAEPKRLSALEMTFPSLDMLGHSSDSDDEYDHPSSRQRHSTGSPANGAAHAHGMSLASRGRLSSFHEYGDRAPPTSLAVLSGLISGSAKVIDRAYAEQGVAVPDIDHAEAPKSKFAKPTPQLKVTSEIYKAIEVCIEACHQLISIVQRPEVTAAEAAYAVSADACGMADNSLMVCRSSSYPPLSKSQQKRMSLRYCEKRAPMACLSFGWLNKSRWSQTSSVCRA